MLRIKTCLKANDIFLNRIINGEKWIHIWSTNFIDICLIGEEDGTTIDIHYVSTTTSKTGLLFYGFADIEKEKVRLTPLTRVWCFHHFLICAIISQQETAFTSWSSLLFFCQNKLRSSNHCQHHVKVIHITPFRSICRKKIVQKEEWKHYFHY